ncbi:MAG TPA: metallophosphoesterase [Chitinophagaceae bacterium]|jgi:predicted MPP superfamily phosphohydrolase|nr:metallophosphoesterase [Chitinophagaceae bacterium]
MKRRTFLKGLAGIGASGLLGGLYAWQVEPFWVEFVELEMPIRNLSKDLNGKMLMQISDVHIGKRFDHNYIIDSFKRAQAYNPDFVVYTGDYVSTYKDEVHYKELEETLSNCVKGKLDTVGILGNHDYGRDWKQADVAEKICQSLERNGINVLRNEQKEFTGLNIIGLDDYWGVNFNPHLGLRNYIKEKPSIVLCHNPDVCDLNVWNGYEGWILSGHTHGGQCKPPFLPPPMLPVKNKRYTSGKIELAGNRTLYINRALGHSKQVRFNVRPEITIFKLLAV